jgi:hypothetical protein
MRLYMTFKVRWELSASRAHILLDQDVLEAVNLLQGFLATLDLREEGLGEDGGGAGHHMDELGLTYIRMGVPSLFMMSHALSRGMTRL